uniref:Ribosomal protein L34e superfamily protein n=1 Tax=Kalanchoe fedtschenkoi TaxID=63787 RepID=A0A7N0VL22_KALFE
MSNWNQVRARRAPSLISGLKIQSCGECQFAIVDFVMLVAALGALACLLFPYAKIAALSCVGMVGVGVSLVKEEVANAPALYFSLALGAFCASLCAVVILACVGAKCGRPGCKGMRKRAAFGVQVQTEEMLKSSSHSDGLENGVGSFKEGMGRLGREHVRLMEARLRKMAPVNGKAVLVYRARCGCSIGRLEVAGPRSKSKK